MGEFGELIERERKKKWVSRRKFYNASNLSCSYPRYTVIEKGSKPYASLDLAVELIKKLNIDESRGLHAFVRDQMPDKQKKSYFIDLNEDYYSSRISSIVIDDDEKRVFFEDSPIYKEISVYISMYSCNRSVSIQELCDVFMMKKSDLQLILNQLETIGIVVRQESGYIVPSGSWLSTPNTSEYRKAVSLVFSDAVNSHFSGAYYEGETFEHSTLRLVNREMILELHLRIKNLARWFSVQPDPIKGEVVPFRFFAGANFAVFGDKKKHYTPGRREIKNDTFFSN